MTSDISPDDQSPDVGGESPDAAPYVTWLMLALVTAVFAAMWVAARREPLAFARPFGDVTLVADRFGDKNNTLIVQGHWWRLVTPVFLHANLVHLTVNALSLVWLGAQMERVYGARKYFLVYMAAGVAGNVASFLRSPAPSLGASGALFGLIGAGLVFPIRFRRLISEGSRTRILRQLLTVTALNFGIGFTVQGVDNWAHGGGMIGGAFAALFLLPDVLDDRPRVAFREAVLNLAVLGTLALIGVAAVNQWRWASAQTDGPILVTVTPAARNAWWSIGVPARWAQEGARWRSPEGAVLEIVDGALSARFVEGVQLIFQDQASFVENYRLKGYPTRRLRTRIGADLLDLYMVNAGGGRSLVIRLTAPPHVYVELQRRLLPAILDSLKIRPVAAPTRDNG